MDDQRKVTQIASLLERMLRLNEELAQSNRHAAESLERTASAAPRTLQNAAQQTLGHLTNDIAKAVHNGLNQPLGDFNRHVAESVNRVNGITDSMTHSRDAFAAVVSKLRWLVISVIVAMALVVAAGSGLLWHYHNVIADNQREAEFVQGINRADVRMCDGRLCARVEQADKGYGDYVLVKPRPE